MWRANRPWRGVRVEVPWIDREPTAIMRDHIRLTTQPFDSPPDAAGVADIIDQIGSDKDVAVCDPIIRTGSSTAMMRYRRICLPVIVARHVCPIIR